MSAALPLDALGRRWAERWRVAELWTDEPITLPQFREAILRSIAHAESPATVLSRLIEDGEYAVATEMLLAITGGALPASDIDQRAVQSQIDARIRETRLEVEAEIGAAEARARRLDMTLDRRKLEAALDAVVSSRRLASERLLVVSQELDAAEELRLAQLRDRANVLPADGLTVEWREQLSRYLDARELELAQWLMDRHSSDDSAAVVLPPRPPVWPYGNEAVERICEWLRGAGRPPAGFVSRIRPDTLDSDVQNLAVALGSLWKADAAKAEAEVGAFVASLERYLACRIGEAPLVVNQPAPGIYLTALRGFDASELPVLAAAAQHGQHPFAVVLAERVAPGTVPSRAIALARSEWEPTASQFRLTPLSLFRLIADGHRRLNLLRDFGSQLPLTDALPVEVPLASEERLATHVLLLRELLVDRPVTLVSGHRGVGKTTITHLAGSQLEAEGWTFAVVGGVSTAAALTDLLEREVNSSGGHRVFIADASTSLPLVTNQPELAELLNRTRVAAETHASRVIITVPPCWRDAAVSLGAPLVWLDCLDRNETRQIVTRFLDVLGIPPSSAEVSDRIAFYSGGRTALIFGLLRAVLRAHVMRQGRRRIPLEAESLELAWRSAEFREHADKILLAPIRRFPEVMAVLALLIGISGESGGADVPYGELESWWQLYVPGSALDKESLSALVGEGLVKPGDAGSWRISRNGEGLIAKMLIATPEEAIRQAFGTGDDTPAAPGV